MNFDYSMLALGLSAFSCTLVMANVVFTGFGRKDMYELMRAQSECLQQEINQLRDDVLNILPKDYLSDEGLAFLKTQRLQEVQECIAPLQARLEDFQDLIHKLPIPPQPGSPELPLHPRICKNCQHFLFTNQAEICRRKKMDGVTGTVRSINTECSNERKDWPGSCGPDGRYFIGPEGIHHNGE